MSAENSIGDHAPNFTHEDNRVQQSRMRWRTKNDKFSGSRRIGRYVDSLGVSYSRRCASCACTTLSLSLSFLYTLSIPLFCTLYARLRVNREFHRVSTIGPNSTPAIFLLFLVWDFYVHMWHTFQVGRPFDNTIPAILCEWNAGMKGIGRGNEGDLWPRRRSCRDIGFVFTVTQWYARTHRSTRLLPFVRNI
ncbi:uncharacterized protein LOC122568269 isoform X2 [Bombus pyrosoma]|uniref:uncharacterized protein LOC122568269 isoform X2 n=1 Tax=Bombus pyrosoma TaxID=396416 RepID=UPI001CB96FA1|nr:uncharacterized protein LOC122568269 isoform X2 [Bombus pyrosoma]